MHLRRGRYSMAQLMCKLTAEKRDKKDRSMKERYGKAGNLSYMILLELCQLKVDRN